MYSVGCNNRVKIIRFRVCLAFTFALFLIAFPFAGRGLCERVVYYRIGDHKVPKAIADRYNRIVLLTNESKFEEAEPLLEKLIDDQPEIDNFKQLYVETLFKLGKRQSAYELAKKLIENDPNSDVNWRLLSNCALGVGKDKEALEGLKKYVGFTKDPKRKKHALRLIEITEKRLAHKNDTKSPEGTYLAEAIMKGVKRWTKDKMPLKVYIAPGEKVSNYSSEYKTILKESFLQWQEKTEQLVQFEFVDSATKSDIECYWTDDPNRVLFWGEGGHCATFDASSGRQHCEIVFLTQSVAKKPVRPKSMQAFTLHEIGHALGIAGHSNNPEDIMYAIATSRKEPGVSRADSKTLKLVYSMKPTEPKAGDLKKILKISHSSSPKKKALVLLSEGNIIFKKDRNPVNAMAKYKEALKLNPDLSIAKHNLGLCLGIMGTRQLKAKKYKEAEGMLRRAVQMLESTHAKAIALKPAYTNYALVLKYLGKSKEMEIYRKKVDELAP